MAEVLFFNQYYAPDTAATGTFTAAIAEQLAADGHEVTAVVGQPSYVAGAADAPAREVRNGVRVVRVPMGSTRGRDRMRSRLLGYLRYLAGAARAARASKPDVIVTFHTPPFLPLVALFAARRARARIVYVPQDIHPDILVASNFMRLPTPVRRAWDAYNRMVLRRVAVTVALGRGMERTLVAKGAPPATVEVIPLWAEPELEPRARDRDVRESLGVADEQLLVLSAGNLGVMHSLDSLLDAATRLQDHPVSFVIAGHGVRRPRWERGAAERGLQNVRFIDPRPGDEGLAGLLAAADVTLVTLDPGMELLAVPSRSFAFLAAGKPVIAEMAAGADVAEIVERTGSGWHTEGSDDLVRLLSRLAADPEAVVAAGANARAAFEDGYRRAGVAGRYTRLVEKVSR